MKETHADYWMKRQYDAETARRLEIGRQIEREEIEDAERARDGLPPIVRPFVETPVFAPPTPTGRPPDRIPLRRRKARGFTLRDPGSPICEIARFLQKKGKLK